MTVKMTIYIQDCQLLNQIIDHTLTKSQPTLSSPLPPPQPTVLETSLGVPASSEDHKLSEFPEIDTCADLLSTLHADGVPPQTSKAFQVSVTSLKQSGQNPSFSVKIQSGVVTIRFFFVFTINYVWAFYISAQITVLDN